MKIDWTKFAVTMSVFVAITAVFWILDPQHDWQPRLLAMCLLTPAAFIFARKEV